MQRAATLQISDMREHVREEEVTFQCEELVHTNMLLLIYLLIEVNAESTGA